jgi:cell division protein FtsI (penicillin-binding protein 3)
MKFRFRIVIILFIAAFLGLLSRLFYWQIIKAKELSGNARNQHQGSEVITAPRGNILSSDGTYLAKEITSYLLYASVPDIKDDYNKIADKLSPLLIDTSGSDGMLRESMLIEEASRLKALFEKKGLVWLPLKHKLDQKKKEQIETMKISGMGFDEEPIRDYPEASSAAHLLGFVGKDSEGANKGYFGLEGYYDLPLSGKSGFVSREKDARGIPIAIGDSKEVSAVSGVDLLTHINKGIQLSVETKLKSGLEKYGAKAGTAIVMDPKSGAILAMSSYPSYDPSSYSKYSDEYFRNPAISDVFEPGSVFKILVMASGLDKGVIKPDTKCDICAGPLKVDKYEIETWNNKYYPDSSMTDVIVHSDNVGMAFVGQKLGADDLYDYLTKFGLGELTGIDLQGEVTPKMRERGTWNIVDLATTTFGQGIATTPIQFIRAASVIANGGYSVKPQVVAKLVGDGWDETIKPQIGERVISKSAASEITMMMVEAAKSGESKWTNLQGFRVAGKTGTAQIPIAGHYDAEKTIASFIGFAPYDDPKFIMLITLKEPQSSIWASETAAPLWYSIARDLFIHFGIQPDN